MDLQRSAGRKCSELLKRGANVRVRIYGLLQNYFPRVPGIPSQNDLFAGRYDLRIRHKANDLGKIGGRSWSF